MNATAKLDLSSLLPAAPSQTPSQIPMLPTPPSAAALAAKPGLQHWTEGVAFAANRDWGNAANAFSLATQDNPGDALYWINLANAQRRAGDLSDALASADRALNIDPREPLALRLKGECLTYLHRYEDAVATFQKLEDSGVQEYDAMVLHGANLQSLRYHMVAIDKLMQAAAIKPQAVDAHALMATSFRDMMMVNEAIECLQTVLALAPGNLQAQSHLSYERRHLCDWQEHEEHVQRLRDILSTAPAALPRVATVFGMLSLPISADLLLVAARGEALAAAVGVTEMPRVNLQQRVAERLNQQNGHRTRIGMVSFDFHEHPVSQLLVEVLEGLNRDDIELSLYASGPDDKSALRQRIINAADHFVDIRGLSDRQAAQRIRDDGIDVLVDLSGHTRGHRLGIFAFRPAPVQTAFLGYAGTTGAPYIDYLIGDPYVTPIGLAPCYSEKLAQMPLVFQPNGRWRPLPAPMSRADAGLPEGAFVMCAFNHTYKILPEAFDIWCSVMREVPKAVLWLKETNGQLHDNVRQQAEQRGVSGDRIHFAQNVRYDQHFSRMALADVFVDTWPYNAHTTASDALWAGVPVVTVYGDSFASRVAASVLNAVGMAELAFQDPNDYRLAILALALTPELLADYKQRLVSQRMSLPLFDSQRYTREFEALFKRMAQRWYDGKPCDHLLAAEPSDV
jgi:predicted O-linked N-acetylglucosamine transferase (SPINDLY family)